MKTKRVLLVAALLGLVCSLGLSGCEKKDLEKELRARAGITKKERKDDGQPEELKKPEDPNTPADEMKLYAGRWVSTDGEISLSLVADGSGTYFYDSGSGYTTTQHLTWRCKDGIFQVDPAGLLILSVKGKTMSASVDGRPYDLIKES